LNGGRIGGCRSQVDEPQGALLSDVIVGEPVADGEFGQDAVDATNGQCTSL